MPLRRKLYFYKVSMVVGLLLAAATSLAQDQGPPPWVHQNETKPRKTGPTKPAPRESGSRKSTPSSGPVVVNGSFEDDAFSSDGTLGLGCTQTLTGWTTQCSADGEYPWGLPNSNEYNGGPTPYGNQWVIVGDFGNDTSWIQQTVSGFTPGQTYTLSFALASEGTGGGSQVQVSFPSGSTTSSQVFTAPLRGPNYWDTWGTFEMAFVATAASVTFQFEALADGSEDLDVGIDNVSIAPGGPSAAITDTSNIMNGSLTVQLNAPAGTTGNLALNIVGANSTQAQNFSAIASGTQVLDIDFGFPPDIYSSANGTWAIDPSVSIPSYTFPTPWDYFREVRFSQYNVPAENSCSSTQASAYIVSLNGSKCDFTEISLSAQFIAQAWLNGTGRSISYGTLKNAAAVRLGSASNQKCYGQYPTGAIGQGINGNTFARVQKVTGRCGTELVAGSAAMPISNGIPFPLSGVAPLSCGYQLNTDTGNYTTDFIETVADGCPACSIPSQNMGADGHIDSFTTDPACGARNFKDLPGSPFYTSNITSDDRDSVIANRKSVKQTRRPQGVNSPELLPTESILVGLAETKQVSEKAKRFDPSMQPKLYWHDQDWAIDLVIPSSENDMYSLKIQPAGGITQSVNLPRSFAEIESISRAPGNKAIVVADLNGDSKAFAIVDLKLGQIIDEVGTFVPRISPNNRFVLYDNWFPPHAETGTNEFYHLYDVLKSPNENVCAYAENDPKHQLLNDAMRGFQVYPRTPGQTMCDDGDNGIDYNIGSHFTWSPDSSRIVFADVKGNILSFVLVTMPLGTTDLPSTSIYTLVGDDNVCSAGKPCSDLNVLSLGWDGDKINAVLVTRPEKGTSIERDLTIPISKFAPVNN